MTNEEILQIAMAQSAIDLSCHPADFKKTTPVISVSQPHPKARKYLTLPQVCDLCSYGNNVVAAVAPELENEIAGYLARYDAVHCFETPHLHALSAILRPHGYDVCFQAEYFLPDPELLHTLPCPYPVKFLTQKDFTNLYLPQWSNALCKARKQLDILGAGAYAQDQLNGLAGASADCDTMWQIGIDVLPTFRRNGIAAALISTLAIEILSRGIVPFYCRAWSNLASGRSAIRSGFRPAFVHVTAKPLAQIAQMNDEATPTC